MSKYFSLAELTSTSVRLPNDPPPEVVSRLDVLGGWLDTMRDQFGPFHVNSGYRSPAVNAVVGGSSTSAHCFGSAADVVPLKASFLDVARWLSGQPWLDQMIWEMAPTPPPDGVPRWLHVGIPKADGIAPRRESLWCPKPGQYVPIAASAFSSAPHET